MSYINDVDDRYINKKVEAVPDISKCTLRLELTNICNHKCIMCPHAKQERKPVVMDRKFAFRIIEESAKLGVKRAALFLNGEPFLVNNLHEYIRHCKNSGMEYVFITTNGAKAKFDDVIASMDAGLDSIKFSINAGSRETYKLIHGSDDYDYVIELIKRIKKYRDKNEIKCKILSGFVITDYTIMEAEKHYNRIKEYVDDICFFKPDNFGGYMVDDYSKYVNYELRGEDLPFPYYDYPQKTLPCSFLSNCVTITAEGFLSLCCSEALNYLVVEDLNNQSLEQAWKSPAMQKIRNRHQENKLKGTQCYNCMFNVSESVEPLNNELFSQCIRKDYVNGGLG